VPVEHLYVHVPFCPKICPYCSFYKLSGGTDFRQEFVESLLLELQASAATLRPKTIFFGGGTPTMLTLVQLEKILQAVHDRVDLSQLEEWTFEMNPATVNPAKARLLLDAGVNRFSMGVQAWQPHLLKVLGRIHSADQVVRSVETLRGAGAENLNLDLMFGVPGQSLDDWQDSVARTIKLEPAHISAYCLTYEEDTEFFRRRAKGEFKVVEEEDARFFEKTPEWLAAANFAQYEISNFARPGRECRHNLAYWNGSDYLGLGPSAWSTVGWRRWRNKPDTRGYVRSWREEVKSPIDEEEALDATIKQNEQVAFGLRMNGGVPLEWVKNLDQWQRLEAAGYLESRGEKGRLTRRGRLVADSVAEALMV